MVTKYTEERLSYVYSIVQGSFEEDISAYLGLRLRAGLADVGRVQGQCVPKVAIRCLDEGDTSLECLYYSEVQKKCLASDFKTRLTFVEPSSPTAALRSALINPAS